MFTKEEIRIANATCRSNGASALNKDGSIRAIVPKYVETIADKEDKILDFGAGKNAIHTKYLRDKGFKNVTAYDFGENSTEYIDKNALNRKYDIVFASNVLNVSSSIGMLIETIEQIFDSVHWEGKVVMNYPASPRKTEISARDIEYIIKHICKMNPIIVGGTKSAPVWEITKVSYN